MPLLYRGLRHLLRLGLELYFVEVETSGEVPREGPLILAANHPNSIMDAVVLGTQVPRPISFLARSGLFRNPIFAALFRASGVVPVYRRQDGTAPDGANDDAFRACEAIRAITAFLAGAVVFGTTYALLAGAVGAASGSPWWGLAYAATLPPSGLFYLRWRRQLARHAHRIFVRTLFLNDRKLLRRLLIEREQLLMEVEAVTTRRGGRARKALRRGGFARGFVGKPRTVAFSEPAPPP